MGVCIWNLCSGRETCREAACHWRFEELCRGELGELIQRILCRRKVINKKYLSKPAVNEIQCN